MWKKENIEESHKVLYVIAWIEKKNVEQNNSFFQFPSMQSPNLVSFVSPWLLCFGCWLVRKKPNWTPEHIKYYILWSYIPERVNVMVHQWLFDHSRSFLSTNVLYRSAWPVNCACSTLSKECALISYLVASGTWNRITDVETNTLQCLNPIYETKVLFWNPIQT